MRANAHTLLAPDAEVPSRDGVGTLMLMLTGHLSPSDENLSVSVPRPECPESL